MDGGMINSTTGKAVLERMFAGEGDPKAIVEKHSLAKVSDTGALTEAARRVIAANADAVRDHKAGKDKVFGFLMGQMMKETRGKADPETAKKVLLEEIAKV